MKTKLLLLIITTLSLTNSYCQVEDPCGTMKNLEEQIKKDPSIKERMFKMEKQNQEWIEKNGRGFKKHSEVVLNKNSNSTSKSSLNTNDLCGYNNTLFTTISAPTTINSIVSPLPNCTFGGEYVRVTNLIAGNTYRISTIGVNNFDTQITIYPAGGGSAVAFNDDWNGSIQSELYFTPFTSGNYDILIDKFGCLPESQCASLEVELWRMPRPVITIPVVFHIFHNGEPVGTGTNISDARIQSQIDALNEDYRRLNSGIYFTPAPFKGASADPLIQFCLAQQDPNGIPTNGIMRYLITQADLASLPTELQCLNYLVIENILKPTTIWNRDKYLNIWVSDRKQLPPTINGQPNTNNGDNQGCNYSSETIGYAQFPGQLATAANQHPELTDGVWISYTTVGRIGNATPNYNLGTNATHEIGHWLNLKHIWGDDTTANPPLPACSLDDDVLDTPLQGDNSNAINILPNICPSFPVYDSCNGSYPGIMYMNYMDYGFDQCKSMLSFGQSARIDATLFNQRASLLTSPGCLPGSYKVVISQIYGGGGNTGATYSNDFIELYNRGTVAQNLNGWSVQYAAFNGPNGNWNTTSLPNFPLQPGQYFLIKCAAGGGTAAALPLEDATSSTINLGGTAGKIILVNTTTHETTANPTGSQIVDKVGYGSTPTGYEGSGPTGTALTNTTAAFRNLGGCTDTDNNLADFTTGTPSPRNSASPFQNCSNLSVHQNALATVTVYPNPTYSKVFFDNTNYSFDAVSIYNYLGQEVATSRFTSFGANQEIDMSTLAKGVYILKFKGIQESQSVKIMKQ